MKSIPALLLSLAYFAAVPSLMAVDLPYTATFTDEDIALWRALDGNEDGKTWVVTPDGKTVCVSPFTDYADDWLVTPVFHLEAGCFYELKFTLDSKETDPQLSVFYGTAIGVDALTIPVEEKCLLTDGSPKAFSYMICPENTADYYFGFRCGIVPGERQVTLYDFSFSDKQNMDVSRAVSDLSVTAAADGSLACEISFTAPSLNRRGEPLTELSRIDIVRDDRLEEWIMPVEPGQKVTYTSKVPKAGFYKYQIIPYSTEGQGLVSEHKLYVGLQVPAVVPEVDATVRDDDHTVDIVWQPVTVDKLGHELGDITYKVYQMDPQRNRVLLASGLTDTHFSYTAEASEQMLLQYVVTANASMGESEPNTSAFVCVGAPYDSWSDSGEHKQVLEIANSSGTWRVLPEMDEILPQDDDGMMFVYHGVLDGSSADLITGRVDLSKIKEPAFTFHVYNNSYMERNEGTVHVFVIEDGDTEIKQVHANIVYDYAITGQPVWYKVCADLREYAGKKVRVMLTAVNHNIPYIIVDNLRFESIPAREMAITDIGVPAEAKRDVLHNVRVVLCNFGSESPEEYTVTLYANGHFVRSQKLTKALRYGGFNWANFPLKTDPTSDEEVTYYAVLETDCDTDPTNNVSRTVKVPVLNNGLASPFDLKAAAAGSDVTLAWQEPDYSTSRADAVVESFETFEGFSTELGDWTTYDVDRGAVNGIPGLIVPNINPGITLGSFWVWEDGKVDGIRLPASTGDKCLISFSLFNRMPTDDWLVSPELSGHEQRIEFKGYSNLCGEPQEVELYFSDGGTEPEDFWFRGYLDFPVGEWKPFYFDVPEGTRHFAMRVNNPDYFIIMMDDFRFVPAWADFDGQLQGYNVYRDGQKLNTKVIEECAYTDTAVPAGDHSYRVVAVYDKGTSAPSAAASAQVSGLQGVGASPVKVSAVSGQVSVSGAEGVSVSVTAPDGKVLYNGPGEAHMSIPAAPGIYIVKAGQGTWKVVVR